MKWVFIDYVRVYVLNLNNMDQNHDLKIVVVVIMIINFIIKIIDFIIIIINRVDQVIINKLKDFIINIMAKVIEVNINKAFIIEDIVIFIKMHYY